MVRVKAREGERDPRCDLRPRLRLDSSPRLAARGLRAPPWLQSRWMGRTDWRSALVLDEANDCERGAGTEVIDLVWSSPMVRKGACATMRRSRVNRQAAAVIIRFIQDWLRMTFVNWTEEPHWVERLASRCSPSASLAQIFLRRGHSGLISRSMNPQSRT